MMTFTNTDATLRINAIREQAANAGTDEAHQMIERLRREAEAIAQEHNADARTLKADTTFALRTLIDALLYQARSLREEVV